MRSITDIRGITNEPAMLAYIFEGQQIAFWSSETKVIRAKFDHFDIWESWNEFRKQ